VSETKEIVDRSPAEGAHPRFTGLLLLTAFLAAATVPALHSWTRRNRERQLSVRRAELDELLRSGPRDRRSALSELQEVAAPERAVEVPAGERRTFEDTLVFSPAVVSLFRTQGTREGEFERALKPPANVTSTANRDAVELRWSFPAGFSALSEALRDLPLLRLGFRVYRWHDAEEPRLVASLDASAESYIDRDLPLWRVRFQYCVATVLEGTLGDLPTLLESKRSPVITVETPENFELAVLGGSAGRVRLSLRAWVDRDWRSSELDLSEGAAVATTLERDGKAVPVDTGLTVREVRVIDGTTEKNVERAEFLPDGRRKVDPDSGRPTFRIENVVLPVQTIEVHFNDAAGGERTLSAPVAPPSGG
jgi:hypothetical protein